MTTSRACPSGEFPESCTATASGPKDGSAASCTSHRHLVLLRVFFELWCFEGWLLLDASSGVKLQMERETYRSRKRESDGPERVVTSVRVVGRPPTASIRLACLMEAPPATRSVSAAQVEQSVTNLLQRLEEARAPRRHGAPSLRVSADLRPSVLVCPLPSAAFTVRRPSFIFCPPCSGVRCGPSSVVAGGVVQLRRRPPLSSLSSFVVTRHCT